MYCSVKDFGAIGDGKTVDTLAIQKGIDTCSQTGETLYFPQGIYKTSTLFLKDHTHLEICSKAKLEGVENVADFDNTLVPCVEGPSFTKCLIHATGKKNISITGMGVIDGMGQCHIGERPMLIRFIDCSHIVLRDVTLSNAASWCTHMITCNDINIDGVSIDTHAQKNNDGFDLDSCKDVRIANCNIVSQDDSICLKSTTGVLCENIAISNCNITSDTATFKMGTSSKSGFKNITLTNCTFRDCKMGTIKLLMVDGGILENIVISNITMQNVGSPLFIRSGIRNLTFEAPEEMDHGQNSLGKVSNDATGSVKNVIVSNIVAEVSVTDKTRTPIMLAGLENSKLENITLSNIQATFAGGGLPEEREIVVAEDPYRYPEQGHFGTLPVWGFYARHVKGLQLNNIQLSLANADAREMAYFEDVENMSIVQSNVVAN